MSVGSDERISMKVGGWGNMIRPGNGGLFRIYGSMKQVAYKTFLTMM